MDEIIRSIRQNKLEDLDVVLQTDETCPAGAAFANGVSIAPFPKLDPVVVTGDADRLKSEILNWTMMFFTAYAHAQVSLPNQSKEVAVGMAIAYYALRRGSPSREGEYDTNNENVKQAALNWLKEAENQELPMGLGKIDHKAPASGATGQEGTFAVNPQTASNIFFLMAMISTHGQTITTDRIQKFLKAANEPLARVTCALTPAGIKQCWNGMDAAGGVNQTSFVRLASLVYKYVQAMPTFQMGVPQSQLRGLTAFQMVARLHVEYAGVNLREFWTIAGPGELAAIRDIFSQTKEKTAFMAMFSTPTQAASDRLRVSSRLALAFLQAKNDVLRFDRYAGRWAKAPLSPEMTAWVDRNRHVRRGGGQMVGYITVRRACGRDGRVTRNRKLLGGAGSLRGPAGRESGPGLGSQEVVSVPEDEEDPGE